jgi:hypothetical protein
MTQVRRGTVLSFNPSDWTALVMLDGSDTESQVPVGQWIPASQMVANAEVAVLVFESQSTNTDDGIVLGAYGAVGTSDTPTFSGLNLGSATGATAGELNSSGAIRPGTALAVKLSSYRTASLAINTPTSWAALSATPNGLLVVADESNGYVALFSVAQAVGLTAVVSDLSAKYSNTAGTAGKVNIYIAAGVPTIENKLPAPDVFDLYLWGYG